MEDDIIQPIPQRRGRPPKSQVEVPTEATPKRKAGRPRKEEVLTPPAAEPTEATPKRKAGRPRKEEVPTPPAAEPMEATPKRKLGRPRKGEVREKIQRYEYVENPKINYDISKRGKPRENIVDKPHFVTPISDVFRKAFVVNKKEQKLELFRRYCEKHPNLRNMIKTIMLINFAFSISCDLKAGSEYTPNETDTTWKYMAANPDHYIQLLTLFIVKKIPGRGVVYGCSGTPLARMSRSIKEEKWKELLETLPPHDAELLSVMKDGGFITRYNISRTLAIELFPELNLQEEEIPVEHQWNGKKRSSDLTEDENDYILPAFKEPVKREIKLDDPFRGARPLEREYNDGRYDGSVSSVDADRAGFA